MGLMFPKIQHIEDPEHISFEHQLVCVVCGNPEVHVHHLMRSPSRRGQRKSGSNHSLPLCFRCHNGSKESVHLSAIPEPEWFALHGIHDPVGLAENLYALTGDYEACMEIIASAKTTPIQVGAMPQKREGDEG